MEITASDRPVILEALDELRERQATAAACTSLDSELAALESEAVEIEGHDQDLNERRTATERMLRFEQDRLVVLQKITTPEHAKLAALTEELNREGAKLAERKREIAQRCQVIESEKQTALRRSAETFRDECILLIRGAEDSLASILDQTRDTLNRIEAQLGTSIYQVHELTSSERSDTWTTLNRIYRGRG